MQSQIFRLTIVVVLITGLLAPTASAHVAADNPVSSSPNSFHGRVHKNPRFTIDIQKNDGRNDTGYIHFDVDFESYPTCPATRSDSYAAIETRQLDEFGNVISGWSVSNWVPDSWFCAPASDLPGHWGRDGIGELYPGYRYFEFRLRGTTTGNIYVHAKSSGLFDPPQAPSNLEGEPRSSSVTLTWKDNASNESGFEVERSTDGTTWAQIAVPGPDTTGFVDMDVARNTTYHYRVRAANNVAPSDWAGPIVVTTITVPAGQVAGSCGRLDAVAPCGTQGDPVNSATGAYVTSVSDLALPGIGRDFSFTRTYDSNAGFTSDLGQGWTHDFATRLQIESDGDAILHGATGQQVFYKKKPDGSYVVDAGGLSKLAAAGTGFELTQAHQTVLVFGGSGKLTSVSDRNGNTLSLAYAAGLIDTVTDTAGRVIDFSHDGAGLLSSISLPDGRSVSYGYTSGVLTTVTDVRGNPTTYTYDSAQRLESVIDQNGNSVVSNTYGPDGRVAQQIDARGKLWQYTWDGANETSIVIDPRGKQWTDDYDANVLASRTDPLGQQTSYAYDRYLNVIAITDPRGNVTTMTYDGRGNQTSRTAPAPLSYQETWTYNSNNDPLTHQDGRGNTTSYDYDTAGNLISVARPGGTVITLARDPSTGLVTAVTDPRNKTTSFTYESDGDLASVTTPLGHSTVLEHDGAGRTTAVVEARGNASGATPVDYRWSFSYDAANHLTSRIDPLGNSESWNYDDGGNFSSYTDQKSRTTTYSYNAGNSLTAVTAPDQSVTSYTYDDAGNLASRTDANNHVTTYAYDGAGRLEATVRPGGSTWSYSYDPAGNLAHVIDAKGNLTAGDTADGITSYAYDEMNRLTGIDYSDVTPDVSFGYDANSNVVTVNDALGSKSYVYDVLDRLKSVTRGTQVFSYDYDAGSNLISRAHPDGTASSLVYDDDSRLTSVTSGGRTTGYSYDPAGNLLHTVLPGGNGHAEERAYDRAGRLSQVVNKKGLTTLSSFSYVRDELGNPKSITASDGTTTFAYDDQDRLTEVCFPLGCGGVQDLDYIRYTYDDVGSRLTEARPGSTTTYSYDASDRLTTSVTGTTTTSYGHDANGNMTSAGAKSYTYDGANRMTSAAVDGTSYEYGYDATGNRVASVAGASSTSYTWDENNPLPMLVEENAGSASGGRSYLYGHDLISSESGNSESYYHYDGIGSVTNVTDGSGLPQWSYAYEPFGSARSTTKVNPLAVDNLMRYTGEYLDPTGLLHLRARQYDSRLGMFTATDPWPAAVIDPYVSTYAYVSGRPTAMTDPSGLCPWCVLAAIGGAVGGVVNTGVYLATADDPSLRGALGAAATGVVAGAVTAVSAPIGGTIGAALTGSSTGAVSIAATAGVNLAGGALATRAGGAICGGASATDMAIGGSFNALGGGIANKLYPLRGLYTMKQVPYFAPRTVHGALHGANGPLAGKAGGVGSVIGSGSEILGGSCK